VRRPRTHNDIDARPHVGLLEAGRSVVRLRIFDGHQSLVVVSTRAPILGDLACELGNAPRECVSRRVLSDQLCLKRDSFRPELGGLGLACSALLGQLLGERAELFPNLNNLFLLRLGRLCRRREQVHAGT
jgi:hypothetical protein